MFNFNTIQNPIMPELLFAILAKLTIGNANHSEELNKLLDTLPYEKSAIIAQSILKYDSKTDLNNFGFPEIEGGDIDRFALHTAAEALLPQPPIDWVVDSLFSVGTVSMVMGDPGSKKTYAMIDLAVCIAQGKPWLDFATKQAAVLLIDEESGVRRVNRRLGEIMRGHAADGNIPLQYISLARFNLSQNGSSVSKDLMVMEEKIQESNAKFIVIDALADVMPGADENAVKDVQPIFMGLRQVADATESAIVVIHHSNRNGGYRGSSAILGALDLLIKVESKKESPNMDFKVEKNRDGKPVNFAAVAHFEEDKFFLASSISSQKQIISKPRKYVLGYLRNNGASSMIDIVDHANICAGSSARQAVYELAEQELVKRVDNGGSGVKAIYDLTEKGKAGLESVI